MFVSMLDNAKGLDANDPTNPFSRGLLIAVDEENMKAEIVAHYDHPDGDGGLAFRRGNYQPLPNGNVFMCWSEQALQSEHSQDGTLLMQARLKVDWLGTYRAYKFPFVGTPDDPPDVAAEVKEPEKDGQNLKTAVYVSWNGATEVVSPRNEQLVYIMARMLTISTRTHGTSTTPLNTASHAFSSIADPSPVSKPPSTTTGTHPT